MSWLDAVIFLVLVIPAFIGFRRGLVKLALPLLGIVCGVVLAGIFYGSLAEWLSSWLQSPTQANIVAFLIIFFLFVTAGLSLLRLARRFTRAFAFGWGGLTKTMVPLGGIALGVALAGIFYGNLADRLSTWLQSGSQASIVAFVIIFIVVMVVSIELFLLLSSFRGKVPSSPLVGWADRLGGVVFGLAIGAVVAGGVVSILAKHASPGLEATVRDSGLSAFLLNHFPFVLHLLPDEFDTVRDFFR
jgi:membrane protein required for colicin V production